MPTKNRDDEPEARIERLKAQAAALSGGSMAVSESPDIPQDVQEQFWRQVIEAETAGVTDLATELKAIGVALPNPDGLDDEALHTALWNETTRSASMHVPDFTSVRSIQ